MDVAEICQLVQLCFEATLFQYNNSYIRQITGTPMGSPVSVVLAEIVMQKIEQLVIPIICDHIMFWYRYVDDVLACIKIEEVENILSCVNSINNHIQFTAEKEENNSISFLDLKIMKKPNGSLNFGIYRKPTHTDKYLNFDSYNPIQHKNSVIRTLIHRAEHLCDEENKEQEKNHVVDVLQNNGSIEKIAKKVRDNIHGNAVVPPQLSSNFASVPYVAGTSERLSRIFRKYDINIAHQPSRKLKNELCHLKDRRPVAEKAGVVYKLACGDCNACYVGETGRQVEDRMVEHRRDINNRKITSKVFEHVNNTGHNFDFDNVSILDQCKHKKVRLHLESVHTYMHSNSINRSLIMDSAYRPLFEPST